MPGQDLKFGATVLQNLPELPDGMKQFWIEHPLPLQEALGVLCTRPGAKSGNVYPLSVDYGRSVEDAVKAGRYNWSNSNITSSNFTTKRKGAAEIVIEAVHFNREISTDEAIRELDKMGYRPVELHELLTLGEKYPDVQLQFLVVGLGSVWQGPDGSRDVPYLGRSGAGRHLDLSWIESDWSGICRFAAVRK